MFDTAYGLLEEGRLFDAEQLLLRELETAKRTYGRKSPELAAAHCDLGNLLVSAGQYGRAVEYFRSACAKPRRRDRDYLTYRLNLGSALAMAGRLDEAESELRRNLRERLDFYGREHPGYAFALEPLANVLLRRGDIGQARQVVDEAVANFWRCGHDRVATALALRAQIATAAGEPAFEGLEHLPDEIIDQIAFAVITREGHDPATTKRVVTGLLPILEERLGPDHQTTLNALTHLVNIGHSLGDQAGRVEATQRVLASYDRQGRAEDAFMAALGLAMAQADAGDTTGAFQTYAQALTRADRPELRAQVLRNWGLALSEAGRTDEAEQRLREAVSEAGRGIDHELLGRSLVALGLFLQHEERLADARQVVETALTILDVAHPDAITARSHLGAITAGHSCGCGDLDNAILSACREFVMSRLPQDLLNDLHVTSENGDFSFRINLRRKPTKSEINHMNHLIESATAEFRTRLASD